MNFITNHKRLLIISLLGSVLISPLISSCGSSGGGGSETSAGIGGTGVTQGRITGFGSIFVNGIEFETGQSAFEVDGDTTLNEDALRIGMVVKITGDVSSDGLTGDAENVEYDDEIQGPIASITAPVDGQRTLTIFDKTVTIDESTTSFDGTDFASIAMNDIIEVSGFQTSTTELEATYVKKTGEFAVGEDVELKGTITDLDSNSFKFGSIKINYDNDTEIEDGIKLVDGLFVEVEGKLISAVEIDAEEIEAEDEDDFEDGEEISLQGIISSFMNESDFMINGQSVNASGAELSPDNLVLEDGLNVEVEGEIVNGVLIAEEVELREGEVKVKAFIHDINLSNNSIEFQFLPSGSIFITTDGQTEFEDELNGISNFSLSQLNLGDFVKIEGIDSETVITASQVKRLTPDPSGEDIEVQGSVDELVQNVRVTVLGIPFLVDGTTQYDPGPEATFFSQVNVGDIVEVVDDNVADGTIDEIELED